MKFNAYAKKIEIIKVSDSWVAFFLGNDGKKRKAHDIIIPGDLKENEIKNYLEDILHEWATPVNKEIKVIE